MRELLSLKQLRYLVAVADHLNFTRAAETCCISQSTLSSGLQELEATLGVVLVERDRRKVLLTEVGREVAERARANPDHIEATSLLTLLQMIESGLGIGLIPALALSNGLTTSPRLTVRQPADPAPRRTIALATRPSSPRVEELRVLAELLLACRPGDGERR